MSVVWKFPLVVDDEQEIVMPRGAELLHVARQAGVLMLWARVNPEAPKVRHLLCMRGTGHEAPDDARHIASILDGIFVWHFFDQGETS